MNISITKKIIFIVLVIALFPFSVSGKDKLPFIETNHIFLPIISGGNTVIDPRFGINNMITNDIETIGFSTNDRYTFDWKNYPENIDISAYRLTPANRKEEGKLWCLTAYKLAGRMDYCSNEIANNDGWIDEKGFKQFILDNPNKIWIIGNEPLWSGDRLSYLEQARWHHAAYYFIKSNDPSAIVGMYGMSSKVMEKLYTFQFWKEYKTLYHEPTPTDFIAFHYYPPRGERWSLEHAINFLTETVNWLNYNNGTNWVGPKNYWLTEIGLRAWEMPIGEEDALLYMTTIITWLKTNNIGISQWAWWPSSSSNWEENTKLIKNGIPRQGKYIEIMGKRFLYKE